MAHDEALVSRVLSEARTEVRRELERLFRRQRRTGYGPLYDLLEDYPFREGKGMRPALAMAACRAAGGTTAQALVSATALELFHNAFLLHDDVEDGSQFRRGAITLFEVHGIPIAINVGDATNVLAMGLLLRNTDILGIRKALLVLREVERMARESVEGQAIELGWIREGRFDLEDRDYVRMAYKKTCWYTVIAPLRIGVICGAPPGPSAPLDGELLPLVELGHLAGIAFQISDDMLNLEADETHYGKERSGDLWEGKRTVMLLHFMRTARPAARARALRVLATPRARKRGRDVAWLLEAMRDAGSLEHGRRLALEYSERALELDATAYPWPHDTDDRRFLREMLRFVIDRTK
ncbi:MAG TPA: polyprenyl synthetase family protein [Longimicrobiaceae bacterium]|nr:polyprenyl synthetase family protein [Longimicrobiaceae bacterium]